MNRKQFLKALFAYGAAVAVAPSRLAAEDRVCRYPDFGFQLRKPAGWIHLSIPRLNYLTERQREQVGNTEWFDLIREVSGLPVALFSPNENPWDRPTPLVAAYANGLPQGLSFEEFFAESSRDYASLFPKGKNLTAGKYRQFGPTQGAEVVIEYELDSQVVRSRAAIAWGTKFEICLSLEDYPDGGSTAVREFDDVIDSLVVS